MAVLAQLDTRSQIVSRRGRQRRALRLSIDEAFVDGRTIDIILHDLSVTGLLIETNSDLSVGDVIQLEVPESGPVDTEIMWHSGNFYGCQFEREISKKAISAALLRSSYGSTPASLSRALAEVDQLPNAPAEDADPAIARLSPLTKLVTIGALALAAWSALIAATAVALT